ncbi:unnamed protein product, partial [Mesorhabditis belari]|uniref:Potassium channel domain-containing protein n=1 Tax=Mesorhabditis belari TaxID=2138241 RepID=A0AAF3FJW6_9BILA
MAFPNASDLVLREIHFNQEFTYQNVALQFISCMLLINLRRMKFSADIGHTLSAVAPIFGTFLFVVIIAGYILMQENAWTFNESLRFSMGLFTGIGDIWSAPRSLMAKEITYWRCAYFCALMLWYSTGMSLILGSFFEIIVACKFASYRISELKKDELTYMKSLWKSRHELKYKA